MNKRGICWLIVVLAIFSSAALVTAQEAHPEWGYSGESGTDHWGDLSDEFALCSTGRAQSPIDIVTAQPVDLIEIEFDYNESALNIFNNGHTIEVEYDEGSHIVYNETAYDLLQFHFHHPSEHTIGGEHAAMELHLVHRDTSGNLAVVGVFINAADAGSADFATVFDNLPTEIGEPEATDLAVSARFLLPATSTYFTYHGSLTTPPCSQGVRWLVMTEPVELSADQIAAFAAIFDNNARPTQPLNTRDLLVDAG